MTVKNKAFSFGESIPIEDLGGGIKRQIFGFNNQIMMARVWFEEGSEGYVHSHYHSQVSYVESGEFEVNVDGEKQILTAGDSFFIAPNLPHGAVCKRRGVLLDVFSPMREDFVEGEE